MIQLANPQDHRMLNLAPDAPRVRKAHLKSRTGCKTCKIRRVKCDEEKPVCMKCVALGFSCSYTTPKSSMSSRRYLPLAPQTIAQAIPSHFKFEVDDGYRYFEMFQSTTSFEILPRCFDTESIRLILLRAGDLEPSIRHAIAALGALEKASQSAAETLLYDDHWGESNRHQQIALKLYSRAIAHMKKDAGRWNQDHRTALLACLVTLCFEAWIGNEELALQQMQTGIQLVHDGKLEATTPQREYTSSALAVEEDIIQAFDRCAIQVVSFPTAKRFQVGRCLDSLKRDGLKSLSHMPAKFASLKEAAFYQCIIIRYGVYLKVKLEPNPKLDAIGTTFPYDSNPKEELQSRDSERLLLIGYIKQWLAAFEVLSKILYSSGANVMVSAAILKMNVMTMYLCLVCMMPGGELLYDEYIKEFEEVVELAEAVLKAEAGKSTTFCFDIRVVSSLLYAAQKCRCTTIRRKAIALLLGTARREGVWDSLLFGKMMEWAADVEEEFMENGHVPGWARIRGCQKTADLQRRTAMLACQQRQSEWSNELVTREKVIRW